MAGLTIVARALFAPRPAAARGQLRTTSARSACASSTTLVSNAVDAPLAHPPPTLSARRASREATISSSWTPTPRRRGQRSSSEDSRLALDGHGQVVHGLEPFNTLDFVGRRAIQFVADASAWLRDRRRGLRKATPPAPAGVDAEAAAGGRPARRARVRGRGRGGDGHRPMAAWKRSWNYNVSVPRRDEDERAVSSPTAPARWSGRPTRKDRASVRPGYRREMHYVSRHPRTSSSQASTCMRSRATCSTCRSGHFGVSRARSRDDKFPNPTIIAPQWRKDSHAVTFEYSRTPV